MTAAALYGLIAWALLAGTGATFLPRSRHLPVAAAVAALALAPLFAGESPAMALHGALAAPSMTLVQLAIRRLAAPGRPELLRPAAPALLAIAVIFYPLALGAGSFDPYAFGYQPRPLLAALLLPACWLAWRGHKSWLVILGVDLLAYAAGLFANVWDALFDPVLVLLATGSLVMHRLARRR